MEFGDQTTNMAALQSRAPGHGQAEFMGTSDPAFYTAPVGRPEQVLPFEMWVVPP